MRWIYELDINILYEDCLKITISRGVRWIQPDKKKKGETFNKSQNNYLTWSEMDKGTVLYVSSKEESQNNYLTWSEMDNNIIVENFHMGCRVSK